MTAAEAERLSAVEQKLNDVCKSVDEVKAEVGEMRAMLIRALEEKADRTEVVDLRKKVWLIVLAIAGTLATTLLGMLVWLLQGHVVFTK